MNDSLQKFVELSIKCGIDMTYVISYAPGHYYSPLPSKEEVQRVAERVFAKHDGHFPDIDMRYEEQVALYKELARYYMFWPYQDAPRDTLRYYSDNVYFGHADGYWLYAFLRHFKPKRVVEVGSGFSSCLMLDAKDHYLKDVQLTFIEPNPERLLSVIKPQERRNIRLLQDLVQNVDTACFQELEAGDILFVDNSHVGKLGSDVLYLFHTILPQLKSGVIIHLHDIFFPFEYPREWIENGHLAWNECYFLRSFLQYNTSFEVLLFGHWFGLKHVDLLEQHTPICAKNIGGSFWMRKK